MMYIFRGTNAIGLVRSYKRPTPSRLYDSGHKRLLRSIFRMYGNSLPYFWSNFRLRKRTFGDCADKYCCCCRTGVKMMYRRCLLLLMRRSATAVVPVARPLPDSWSRATDDWSAVGVGVVLEVVVATRQVIAIKHSAGNADRCCRPMTVVEPKLTDRACAYLVYYFYFSREPRFV